MATSARRVRSVTPRRGLRRVRAASIAMLALTGLSPPAEANGRYPSAQQLVVDPGNDARLWLRTTYGLLTSGDTGKTWSFICETSLGVSSAVDPSMAVSADGTVLVGSSSGLRESQDGGCTFAVNQDIGKKSVLDLSALKDPSQVLALVFTLKTAELAVWRSTDSGHHFSALGSPLPARVTGVTLDAAPSDPSRLYATAVPYDATPGDGGALPEAWLVRSRDSGTSWDHVPIPTTDFETVPFIAAIHPTRPDTLYVRVQGPGKSTGTIESWLVSTEDAGATWKELFRGSADMLGFALSEDGSRVVLGMGDSHSISLDRAVDRAAIGIYRATAPAFDFTRGMSGQIGGLTRAAAGLYVCASHALSGFELGLSEDDGATATPVLDYGPQILGPLHCGDASPAACADQWSSLCPLLNGCGETPDAGPATPQATKPPGGGGCGCRLGGSSGEPPGGAAWLLLSASSIFVGLRRRAREPRLTPG